MSCFKIRCAFFAFLLALTSCGADPVRPSDPGDSEEPFVVIAPGGGPRGGGSKPKKAVTPQNAGVFRPGSGFQPPHVQSAAGPDVLFSNQIASGYYFLVGEGDEWIEDAAIYPGAVSARAQVNGFEFSYCSEQPDPSRNSGRMILRFYDETLPSRGPVGREIAKYVIHGFPLGGPKGELRCWTVAVDLTGGSECDIPGLGDEGILAGWGLEFQNPKTGPLIASGDQQADSLVASGRGRSARLQGDGLGLAAKVYASADGTRSYMGSEPGPADFLRLKSSAVAPGHQAIWSIANPRQGMNYSLLFSEAPLDSFLGEGSLLIDPGMALPFSPILMDKGKVILNLDPDFPELVFVQVVEHQGELSDAGITGFSNGLVHFTSLDQLPSEGPSVANSSRGAGFDKLPDIKNWESWWVLNKEPYLQLRPKLRGGDGSPYASNAAVFLPSQSQVSQEVLPALKGIVIADGSSELTKASVLALAKVGMERISTTSMLVANMSHRNQGISETAVLGLGVLGDPSNIPSLVLILANTDKGKEMVDRSEVPNRTRAFAAYALGMIGRHSTDPAQIQEVLNALFGAFAIDTNRSPSVLHACVLSMGVLQPKDPSSLAADLFSVVVDETETDELRSHALNAASRLLQGSSFSLNQDMAEYCLELMDQRRTPKPMQQSAIQALGLLALGEATYEEDALDSLVLTARKAKDRHQRSLAMISLGQWGVETNPLSRQRSTIEDALVSRLRKAQTPQKGWAALGLGIFAAGLVDRGDQLTQDTLETLHQSFRRGRNSSNKAACALALAFSKYKPAAEDIRKSLKKVKDPGYRGLVAVSLGIMEDQNAIPLLLKQLEDNLAKPTLLKRTALGLALMNGQEAAGLLLEMLEKGSGKKPTVASVEASSQALALLHNKNAIGPLLAILTNEKSKDMSRVSAAIALGHLVEHLAFPWNAMFGQDINYTVDLPILFEKDGEGLLNQD